MVETTLRPWIGLTCPACTCKRAKITRAEPVSALYEQNRIHHSGAFPELEDECCSFEPAP